jgi:hypothetical protein
MVVAEREPAKVLKVEEKQDNRLLTVMDIRAFYPRGSGNVLLSNSNSNMRPMDSIDIRNESYIICFTGRRGAGKTTLMSFFAAKAMALWNMRVMCNYPIEFMFAREIKGVTKNFQLKSEPLDFVKLLSFNADYKNTLIVIDEAPDLISNMLSMSIKNRMISMFTRQLRKNHNSIFMAAQSIGLIDKNMHWQTDIEVQCEDEAKKYHRPGIVKGSLIDGRWFDHSGNWTGKSTEERVAYLRATHAPHQNGDVAFTTLAATHLWGDEKHKPVFDTYFQQDVWESLRKVELNIDTMKIGNEQDSDEVTTSYASMAISLINTLLNKGEQRIETTMLMNAIGDLNESEKTTVRMALKAGHVGHDRDTKTLKRFYVFSGPDANGDAINFNINAFAQYLGGNK